MQNGLQHSQRLDIAQVLRVLVQEVHVPVQQAVAYGGIHIYIF